MLLFFGRLSLARLIIQKIISSGVIPHTDCIYEAYQELRCRKIESSKRPDYCALPVQTAPGDHAEMLSSGNVLPGARYR